MAKMEYFVEKDSIVREIWGKADTILLIFAGASAEFALNKAVDWLYFTGRLPADPLGRLFSTVSYAREIVFSDKNSAVKAIDKVNSIHNAVETKRGKNIPEWAYRDVLFMLIDYSIRAFEILERKLEAHEKEEVLQVFSKVGHQMKISDLPQSLSGFEKMRKQHMQEHLYYGDYTQDLYRQYREHLGMLRFRILMESQVLVTPGQVRKLLDLRSFSILSPLIPLFKFSRTLNLDWFLKELILPSNYKKEIRALEQFG